MTVRYVGPGGNNANDGLSWANRKLTLNGVEDTPVQAGDVIYVGPGVYREMLTCDVSGTDGNPITYVGDVTGEHTDGVGGTVRITGSTNDTTNTPYTPISATGKNYRTFRGFVLDLANWAIVHCTTCSNWVLEDCSVWSIANGPSVYVNGVCAAWTIRRCILAHHYWGQTAIAFTHTSTVDDCGHVVENCVFSGSSTGVSSTRVGGITVRNCSFIGSRYGVWINTALAAGQTVGVYNCIFQGGGAGSGVTATALGELVEDYNAFSAVTARTNVASGANSNTYPSLFALPLLHAGQILHAPPFGTLSEWSQVKRIAGTGEATDDLFGRTRPETSAKKSRGAVQYQQPIRETTTIDGASGASLKLDDAGRVQFRVPVTAASTTISVKVYREADYAGTLPQMVIKQPGQADRTTTDAGSAATWNTLTDTFTPAAAPPYVVVELVSNNTAGSGNYDTFFDTLSVS